MDPIVVDMPVKPAFSRSVPPVAVPPAPISAPKAEKVAAVAAEVAPAVLPIPIPPIPVGEPVGGGGGLFGMFTKKQRALGAAVVSLAVGIGAVKMVYPAKDDTPTAASNEKVALTAKPSTATQAPPAVVEEPPTTKLETTSVLPPSTISTTLPPLPNFPQEPVGGSSSSGRPQEPFGGSRATATPLSSDAAAPRSPSPVSPPNTFVPPVLPVPTGLLPASGTASQENPLVPPLPMLPAPSAPTPPTMPPDVLKPPLFPPPSATLPPLPSAPSKPPETALPPLPDSLAPKPPGTPPPPAPSAFPPLEGTPKPEVKLTPPPAFDPPALPKTEVKLTPPPAFDPPAFPKPDAKLAPPPALDPPALGTPATFTKPEAKPPALELAPKTTFDVDVYDPKANDTYEAISQEFYNDKRYTNALRAFNQNQPLQGGRYVNVPPIHILKRQFPVQNTGAVVPIGGAPASAPQWDTAPSAPARGRGSFVVPQGGMTLVQIAKQALGSEQRWREVYDLNPQITNASDLLPAGTEVKLPTDTRLP